MGWRTVAAVLDAGTASCAALNAAYFLQRLLSAYDFAQARRLAAAILVVVSLASLIEALSLLALAVRGGEASLDATPWAVVRMLVFAGTASISMLVVRRWVLR
jgi:hypothetical protein